MATEWDEVKRLAADFQRAQLSSTIQRLSERNCIEIVKKLLELKLVDVIFTTDGKEYVTPQHLLKEIQDELIVHGGRINLVDLSRILGLDFSHIEAKASELAKSEANLRLVLGQLIDDTYLDSVAEEINDKLQQTGQITIGELTKYYDLPGDFLEETVHKRLGTSIQGQADPFDARTIFTEAYVARYKAIVRGVLSAVTRPTSISTLINNYKIPERLFYSILEDLIKAEWLAGSISGGRSERASYIPDIYAKSQNEWVDSFYKQNGYLEYDSLVRLGISEPKAYLSKRYKDTFIFLNSCCIGKSILEQAEAAIDEAVNTSSWTDIMPLLPSVFSVEDVQQIIHTVLKSNPKYNTSSHVFCKTLVVSDAFIQDCFNIFDHTMAVKAEEDAQKGAHLFVASQQKASVAKGDKSDEHVGKGKQDKKEERRKKGGKSGGGTQGRETKIRSTKKKYRVGKGDDESDSEGDDSAFTGSRGGKQPELEFLSPDKIEKQLTEVVTMQECPDELIGELANYLYRPLTKKYQEVAKSVFLASTVASSATRRKTHAETQEKLNTMACQLHMFEKGAKLFTEDIQSQLIKYLLKSLCTEMTNMILNYLCTEHGIHVDEDITTTTTPEARQKIISKLPSDLKEGVLKLHNSLNGKTLEDFFKELDIVMGPNICDMLVKKIDKKRERQAAFEYRHTLLNQLTEATDSALCLHLAVLLFILAQTQQMVHASGKFVPQMISFLQKQAPPNIYQLLYEYQDLVMRQLNPQIESEEKSDVLSKLEELKSKLKEMATTYKKMSQSSNDT